MGLLTQASVAIDGSKFKAVNNRDKNFTRAKMERRMAQIEESFPRYLEQLDTADRREPSEALQTKTNRFKEKIETLKQQMRRLERLKLYRRAWACDPNRHFEAHTIHLQLADKVSRTVAVLTERLDQHRVLDLTENKSPAQAGFDRGH
jgi:hypothetical protein